MFMRSFSNLKKVPQFKKFDQFKLSKLGRLNPIQEFSHTVNLFTFDLFPINLYGKKLAVMISRRAKCLKKTVHMSSQVKVADMRIATASRSLAYKFVVKVFSHHNDGIVQLVQVNRNVLR